ncbi:unnamed protein product [Rotaria magnacalcarata]|uniref:Uncharacterized protein n=2 Tax=Rotaria magnacalcarata TaxID=392030 RepID=A0A815CQQ1_9BILA|nr:unnamed protein product [Rotaria magnacalcarata]CAF1438725.1 unnamed protein product [Rotaria magnacalcarata]
MNKEALLASKVVAVTWGEAVLDPTVCVLSILIPICALGSANGNLLGAARCCMVGAQYGYVPEVFACIHKTRLTPMPGITLEGILAILIYLPSNIENLINFFSFSAWIFYGFTFVARFCCKFTKRNIEQVISVPIPLIVILVLISMYLVIAPLISSPSIGVFFCIDLDSIWTSILLFIYLS